MPNLHHQGVYALLRDATADANAIRDFSDAGEGETIFRLKPPIEEVWFLSRLLIRLQDTGTMDSGGYGNGSALVNGIRIAVLNDDDSVLLDLLDGDVIQTNVGWGTACFDLNHFNFGSGDEFILVRWTFSKGGKEVRLDGTKGQSLAVILNDDMSGLNYHTFFAHGWNDYRNSDNDVFPYAKRNISID